MRVYGSTLYVGMAPDKNGWPYISIAISQLKSLLIYTDKLNYTTALEVPNRRLLVEAIRRINQHLVITLEDKYNTWKVCVCNNE